MEIALGVLKWTPNVFWEATFIEFNTAFNGHLEMTGAKSKPKPTTRNEFLDMVAEHESVKNGKT